MAQEIKRNRTDAEIQSFAIINSLSARFVNASLSTDAVWEWVKAEYEVDSRTELDERQWAVVSARLSAAQRDKQLFSVLCKAVHSTSRQPALAPHSIKYYGKAMTWNKNGYICNRANQLIKQGVQMSLNDFSNIINIDAEVIYEAFIDDFKKQVQSN